LRDESRDVRTVLEARERDFLLARTRVTMKSSLENIDLGDYRIDGVKEGESVELPRWITEELVRMGLADTTEEPFETEVVKGLSREKMMGPLQLSPLSSDFYVRMRRRLAHLDGAVKEGKVKREDHDRVKAASYDLIGMRLSKILSLSSTSAAAASLGDKLTPEEKTFFSRAQASSKEWREAILGGGT
jgi:hypothetical protein